MIVLDTNVISEPARLAPDPVVVAWLDRQVLETLFLTATSLAELLTAVELLPSGARKQRLEEISKRLQAAFAGRILPFDEDAAIAYATLWGRARRSGRAISENDGQIAAIASIRGFSVATRDTAPFVAAGVPVVDPWET